MESLFTFLALVLVVIYVLPIIFSWRAYKEAKEIRNDVYDLKKELLARLKQLNTPVLPLTESEPLAPEIKQEADPLVEDLSETPPPIIAVTEEPIITQIPTVPETPSAPHETSGAKDSKPELYEPIGSFKWPAFNLNKTNLEQFIGEKLISIIGIAILVLGIFFTVKWAVDKNMMSDAAKVLVGFAAGAILIGIAHKLSKNYRAFSSILAGGAIAIFYFSVYQSFQAYHLMPQTVAFVAMIFITLFAVVLSTIYNKVELAMIALIGGFLTPFFVSSGEGNFVVLFSYMLILNIGMFCLAYFKKWPILNLTAYVLTLIIYGFWLSNNYNPKQHAPSLAFLFATLFHITFFATALVYNLRKQERFGAPEIGLLLSNAFAYLVAGLFILNNIHDGQWRGLFVLAIATVYLLVTYTLYRKQGIDKNLLYLLIALVCSFISLAGPIQLKGNSITLFWAAEGVLLLYIGQKSNLAMLKQASALIAILTVVSLGMDWNNNYYAVRIYRLSPVLNQAFLTTLIVAISYFAQRLMLRSETETHWFWHKLPLNYWRTCLLLLLGAVILLGGYFEVGYQAWVFSGVEAFRNVMQGTWIMAVLASLLFMVVKKQNKLIPIWGWLALLIFFVAYILYETAIKELCHRHLGGILKGTYYHAHYLLPLMGLLVVALLVQTQLKASQKDSSHFKYASWALTLATLYILSAESIHLWVHNAYERGFAWEDSERKAIKTAWPIIWSICSLVLMVAGMRQRIKLWRLISLSLFTLTIAKLFIYDISNVGQGGKIAAFIILGIILLLVSFLYQKIKGLFTDDNETLSTPNN
jgi:uncharacterized membrane protein